MDYIGVRRVAPTATIIGESRLLGLFTTKAYAEPASETPLLHRKLRQCWTAEDLIEGSHDYKAAVALFDTFPKDELFARPVDDLRARVVVAAGARGHRRVRLLGRRDADGRSASLILALPARATTPRWWSACAAVPRALRHRTRRAAPRARRGRARRACTSSSTRRAAARAALRALEAEVDRARAHLGRRAARRARRRHGQRGRGSPRPGCAASPTTTRATRASTRRARHRLLRPPGRGEASSSRCSRWASRPRVALYKRGAKVELSRAMPMLEDLGLRVIEEISTRLTARTRRGCRSSACSARTAAARPRRVGDRRGRGDRRRLPR
jgi:glutamate dehydrogenase